jgi:hypothetical protein
MYSRWAAPDQQLDPTSNVNTTLTDIVFGLTESIEIPLDGPRPQRKIIYKVIYNDDSLVPKPILRPVVTTVKLPKKKGEKAKTKSKNLMEISVPIAIRPTEQTITSIPIAIRPTVSVPSSAIPIAIRPTVIATVEQQVPVEVRSPTFPDLILDPV